MRKTIAIGVALGAAFTAAPANPQTEGAPPSPESAAVAPWDVGRELVAQDARLTVSRDTDTRFEPLTFETLEAWASFADGLRHRIRVASGLWPEPERTPLNAEVSDPIEREDYVVYKVHFEAFPGFLVTGNLYAPKGNGRYPGVLCPHGHWEHGRFENTERASVAARCITFARMGIVAFSYDMVGYNDSRQFARAWGHDWDAVPREERRAQELWGIHPFGIQLWSGIRALDFLESLPQVDSDRLACTGASGGGTQTFALYAVDDRVKAAAPVNMISHTMQGGDACENAPLIRFNASNVEIGALMAPKPLLMVSATGDWTRETPEVEYPAIRKIYALYGAEDKVENVHIDAGHNFNQQSREAVYRFFGKWLLNEPEKYADFAEPPYTMEPVEDLRVYSGHSESEPYPDQQELISALIDSRAETIAASGVRGPSFVDDYRRAVSYALGVDPSIPLRAEGTRIGSAQRDGFRAERWVLRVEETGGVIPLVLLVPDAPRTARPVLFVHPRGKAAYFQEADWEPLPQLRRACVDDGRLVAVIDVFRRGEMEGMRREIAKYTDTFAPTDTAYQVQDVLAAIHWLHDRSDASAVTVRASDEAKGWGLLATVLADGKARIQFELGTIGSSPSDWLDEHYIPCLASLGGLWAIVTELGGGNIEIFRNETGRLP